MYEEPGAGFYLLWFFIAAASYAYLAVCLQFIARKTDTKDGWMAWIPILNCYLLCVIAGKPGWWLILLFIPIINIIISIIIWMAIAERRGKPNWIGILMIIPFVNIIIPGVLAFSE
ncbi:MAG: hypothetical protein J7K40_06390 [candidate division Zixibacteria bacterium]|nr:hypothetical protein [candidate division Zixibacteria bacterium]